MCCTTYEFVLEDSIKNLAVMCITSILKNPERKDLYFDNINLVIKNTNNALDLLKKIQERNDKFIGDLQRENLELEKKLETEEK